MHSYERRFAHTFVSATLRMYIRTSAASHIHSYKRRFALTFVQVPLRMYICKTPQIVSSLVFLFECVLCSAWLITLVHSRYNKVGDNSSQQKKTKTLWVSCNSLADAQKLKKDVLLHNANDLPIACEYMDRDSIDVIDDAGRFLCHAIAKFWY